MGNDIFNRQQRAGRVLLRLFLFKLISEGGADEKEVKKGIPHNRIFLFPSRLPGSRKDRWLAAFFRKPLRGLASIWEIFRKVLARGAGDGLGMRCSLIVQGWFCHPTVASAGNLVKFEGGCATVTGYKLPSPLVPPSGAGKEEVRPETRKSGHQPGSTLVGSRPRATASPSKRRMRPARCNCFSADRECLHSLFCRSLEVFCFPAPALVSKPFPPTGTLLKDQL